jgi:hypothetical protein
MARPQSDTTKFILSLPRNLPIKEVVASAKAKGLTTSYTNVSRVRGAAASNKAAKPAAGPAKASATTTAKVATKLPPKASTTKPTATAKAAPISKSEFIRQQPQAMPAAAVVAKAKAAGMVFDDAYVSKIRSAARQKAKRKSPVKPGAAPKPTPSAPKAAAKATTNVPSKADFVRARAHLSPKEIVEDAISAGLELDVSYVYNVRNYDRARKGPMKTTDKAASQPAGGSGSRTSSPRLTTTAARSSVEDLLRAAAAELGLGRAIEILQAERARVRSVIGG